MTELDVAHLRSWIGKTESSSDVVTLAPARALAAILDHDKLPRDDAELPPLWHWLYFLSQARHSTLGPDGHPERGGFLPSVPLPRRMWAGGRLEWQRPLRIGECIERQSRVADLKVKHGRSGALVFVLVEHLISAGRELVLKEEHDIVYREPPAADAPLRPSQPAPAEPEWSCAVNPDPVMLFRYSAVTFNGHRIHYDRSYCEQEEGYPGLVVHGPLIATLLLEHLHRQRADAVVERFEFRAVSPLFDIQPFSVHGRVEGNTAQLWALNEQGALAMTAQAELRV